jgi:hypothetical protein
VTRVPGALYPLIDDVGTRGSIKGAFAARGAPTRPWWRGVEWGGRAWVYIDTTVLIDPDAAFDINTEIIFSFRQSTGDLVPSVRNAGHDRVLMRSSVVPVDLSQMNHSRRR